jgi:hypothetical protein
MKNLKKLFVAFIAMATAVSCGDPVLPVELFPEMQYGAYARKMSQTGVFNYFDVANSSIDMHVEYYDEAQGGNITEFDIDVEYVDVIGGGANSVARTQFRTISSSEFVKNSDGYLSSDISLGFTAAMTAVGKDITGIDGGNYFRFWFTITKSDGTTYDYNNTGPNLQSSNAFGALFRLNVSIICPSDLESTWDAVSVGQGPWGCTATSNYSGSWVKSGGDNLYIEPSGQFDWGIYLPCYGATSTNPGGTLKVQDACGILSPVGASRWSEVYTFHDVSSAGNALTLDWTNDYGEGAVSVLTRNDGQTWPDLN